MEKFRIRYFLLEKEFRTQMTNFYNVVTVHKNAENIVNTDITKINEISPRGSVFVREWMRQFADWLDNLYEISYIEAFTSQMWMPIKIASDYILGIREKTTRLHGWILAKSIPYKNPFSENEKRVTVSVLVPELETVMSIRCEQSEAEQLEQAMYEFEQVKPFPLVNRLHHFWKNKPAVKKISDNLDLARYDFLKTSFEDVGLLSCSIEMERYCEIASSQSNKRQLLGATSIVPCRVNNVSFPWMTIESILNPSNQIQIYISESLERSISPNRIEDFEDKFARIICVTWYDTGLEALNHPNKIETLYIEEADDAGELVVDEVIGFLRMRKKIPLDLFQKKFSGIQIDKIPRLAVEDRQVLLREEPKTGNEVNTNFLDCIRRIKKKRSEINTKNGIVVTPEDILDPRKGIVRSQSRKINYVSILMEMIKSRDFDGFSEMSLPIADRKKGRSIAARLLSLGLISKRNKGFSVTPGGFEVACRFKKDRVNQIIDNAKKTNGIISVAELESSLVPPSILIKYLSEAEGIIQSTVSSIPCNIFWYSSPLSNNAENRALIEEEVERMIEPAFKALNKTYQVQEGQVGYSIKNQNPKKPLSDMLVKTILQILKNRGSVTFDGTCFDYPLPQRITRIFEKNPSKFFTTEEIMSQVIIPWPKKGSYGMTDEMKKKTIVDELNNLYKNNKIMQVDGGLWTLAANHQSIQSRYENFVRNSIRNIIVRLVDKKSPLDKNELLDGINSDKKNFCVEGSQIKIDWDFLRDEILSEMISNKEIVFDYYGLCKKGTTFQQRIAKQELA